MHSSTELIRMLVRTVALGGNLLLNVGPTADGRIIPPFAQRLRDIGSFIALGSCSSHILGKLEPFFISVKHFLAFYIFCQRQ